MARKGPEKRFEGRLDDMWYLRRDWKFTPPRGCTQRYNGGMVAKKTKVEKVMKEYKEGTLHSGSKKGPVVTSKKQAVAIALSEQREKDAGKKK